MKARIYQPAKTAVQSGRRKTRCWIVETEPSAKKIADPLIGWIGSNDTNRQVQLHFSSKEAAIAYCKRRGLDYDVSEPQQRIVRPKAYADNFTRPV